MWMKDKFQNVVYVNHSTQTVQETVVDRRTNSALEQWPSPGILVG